MVESGLPRVGIQGREPYFSELKQLMSRLKAYVAPRPGFLVFLCASPAWPVLHCGVGCRCSRTCPKAERYPVPMHYQPRLFQKQPTTNSGISTTWLTDWLHFATINFRVDVCNKYISNRCFATINWLNKFSVSNNSYWTIQPRAASLIAWLICAGNRVVPWAGKSNSR